MWIWQYEVTHTLCHYNTEQPVLAHVASLCATFIIYCQAGQGQTPPNKNCTIRNNNPVLPRGIVTQDLGQSTSQKHKTHTSKPHVGGHVPWPTAHGRTHLPASGKGRPRQSGLLDLSRTSRYSAQREAWGRGPVGKQLAHHRSVKIRVKFPKTIVVVNGNYA